MPIGASWLVSRSVIVVSPTDSIAFFGLCVDFGNSVHGLNYRVRSSKRASMFSDSCVRCLDIAMNRKHKAVARAVFPNDCKPICHCLSTSLGSEACPSDFQLDPSIGIILQVLERPIWIGFNTFANDFGKLVTFGHPEFARFP